MVGYRNYTTCIYCDDLELVEQALTQIFKQEGISRVPLPLQPPTSMEKLCYDPWECIYEIWVVGLFAGASGWTIVKTAPQELLCRRAKGECRPRLSALAMQLDCDAFYLGVYETIREFLREVILLEADALGRIFVSGKDNYTEKSVFYDELINSQEFGKFFLIDVPEEIYRVEKELQKEETRKHQQWEEQFKEDYAQQNFPLWTLSELEQWKARFKENPNQLFEAEGGKQLFDAWAWAVRDYRFFHSRSAPQIFDEAVGQILGGSHSYWNLDNLVYQVYTQQQQLQADGARLLYFQPPADYNPTSPYINTPLDFSSDPEGDDWFLDDEREDEGDTWFFWVDEDD